MKMLFPAALALAMLAGIPAQAQSDRYTRPEPQAAPTDNDQQAQTPEQRKAGEIEDLRQKSMSSPNVRGQKVPEDPATGVPEAQQGSQPKREEGGMRP